MTHISVNWLHVLALGYYIFVAVIGNANVMLHNSVARLVIRSSSVSLSVLKIPFASLLRIPFCTSKNGCQNRTIVLLRFKKVVFVMLLQNIIPVRILPPPVLENIFFSCFYRI